MSKWDKLTAFLMQQGNVVRLTAVQLGQIVGPLSRQTYRRISYWDPFMGKAVSNPGSAAKKAGFVVTRFEWKRTEGPPILESIELKRL